MCIMMKKETGSAMMIEAEEGESSVVGFSFCDSSKVLIR